MRVVGGGRRRRLQPPPCTVCRPSHRHAHQTTPNPTPPRTRCTAAACRVWTAWATRGCQTPPAARSRCRPPRWRPARAASPAPCSPTGQTQSVRAAGAGGGQVQQGTALHTTLHACRAASGAGSKGRGAGAAGHLTLEMNCTTPSALSSDCAANANDAKLRKAGADGCGVAARRVWHGRGRKGWPLHCAPASSSAPQTSAASI